MKRAGIIFVVMLAAGAAAGAQEKAPPGPEWAKVEALQRELGAMRSDDQRYRREAERVAIETGPDSRETQAVWNKQDKLDRKNQKRLAEIIKEWGWPGYRLAGPVGAQAAFLIVQHADLGYQRKYFPLLKKAVEAGDARPSWAALLEDRIRVREGKKQIYGTQGRTNADTRVWELYPIEDEENVDERRAKVGMGPIAAYLRSMDAEYVPPKKKKKED